MFLAGDASESGPLRWKWSDWGEREVLWTLIFQANTWFVLKAPCYWRPIAPHLYVISLQRHLFWGTGHETVDVCSQIFYFIPSILLIFYIIYTFLNESHGLCIRHSARYVSHVISIFIEVLGKRKNYIFLHEETKALRRKITCPRSYS